MNLSNWISAASAMVTAIGVLVAIFVNSRTLRQNSRIMRANWIFSVTMEFHKDKRLYDMFDSIQYKSFTFKPEMPNIGGDLSTNKETELIYFLDFLNGVCAAIEQKTVTVSYLRRSTLGYAIEMATTNDDVRAYLHHVAQYDTRRKSSLISFGFLRDNRSFGHLRSVSSRFEADDKRFRKDRT